MCNFKRFTCYFVTFSFVHRVKPLSDNKSRTLTGIFSLVLVNAVLFPVELFYTLFMVYVPFKLT